MSAFSIINPGPSSATPSILHDSISIPFHSIPFLPSIFVHSIHPSSTSAHQIAWPLIRGFNKTPGFKRMTAK